MATPEQIALAEMRHLCAAAREAQPQLQMAGAMGPFRAPSEPYDSQIERLRRLRGVYPAQWAELTEDERSILHTAPTLDELQTTLRLTQTRAA